MGFNGVTSMPHWQGSFPVTLNVNNNDIRVIARYRDSLNTAFEDLNDNQKAVFIHEEGQTDPPDQGSARFDRRRRE